MIKDSGERKEFESGAVRDIQKGKGRCDLLPLDTLAYLCGDEKVLTELSRFMDFGRTESLQLTIYMFCEQCLCCPLETAILDLSKHYEEGAIKYDDHNWRKGIPVSVFINSAVRHYFKYKRGDNDEHHDRAFLWNIVGALWTLSHHPELEDIDHAACRGEC
ncbi:MAG: DUF5664 domain-containing protein [Eubacterium sp.]